MDQYIVSQWFKYRKELETFYKTQINTLKVDSDGCLLIYESFSTVNNCPREADENPDWPNTTIMLCDKVVENLLKHVVNKGKDSLKLRLVDNECYNLDMTMCYDVVYSLRDGRGHYWVISAFFGTADSLGRLYRMTRQKLLTLMMHLSLLMVQRLKKVSDCVYASRIVQKGNSCTCSIHCLIDLQYLDRMSQSSKWDICCTLENLPRKTIEPLFFLLTEKQRRELFLILDSLVDDEDQQDNNLTRVENHGWVTSLMGRKRANLLIEKLKRYNLTGHFAICSSEPRGTGELHYGRDVSYKKMEDYDSRFTGESYFVAVGKTLNELIENIRYEVSL